MSKIMAMNPIAQPPSLGLKLLNLSQVDKDALSINNSPDSAATTNYDAKP